MPVQIIAPYTTYDGENIIITIKKVFQPLVEIASLINGGHEDA